MRRTCVAPAKLDDGWSGSRPEERGLDPSLVCSIAPRLDVWKEANVHVVVVRHGALVYEGSPARTRIGAGAGTGDLQLQEPHASRAAFGHEKPALVVGTAVGRGWIKGPHATVKS